VEESTIELSEAMLSEGEKRIARQIAAVRKRERLDPESVDPSAEDDLMAKARAKGLNIRGVLRKAETIRNQGSELDPFDVYRRIPKKEVQGRVDASRQMRGKMKQTHNPYVIGAQDFTDFTDPRSGELRSKVDRNKYNREQNEKRKLEAEWKRKHGYDYF